MFCTGCGTQMTDQDAFCSRCGRPVGYMPPRKLMRDMRNKKVGGVCAGFANYFGIDMTIMRLIWVLVTIFTGAGIIAYPLAWIIMPADYTIVTPPPQPQQPPVTSVRV